ncbi:MAG: hypothetical protein QW330_03905 [Nitrososphaerota archaeon]
MSSLGAIATSAVFAIIVIASMGAFMSTIFLGYELFRNNVILLWEEAGRAGGRIDVISISVLQDNRSLEVLLLNRGMSGIRAADFGKIDIILVYGRGKAKWLPYDPAESLDAGWRPLNITYEGLDEIINPTSPDFSSGIWDPGEALAVRVWLDSSVEGRVKLIIVSPTGVGES